MEDRKIANIVFYKFYDGDKEIRNACIFYNDGTVNNVDYEDGISACEEVVKEHHITSKEAFKNMINNNMIHVVYRKDLERNFKNYIVKEDNHETEDKEDNLHNMSVMSSSAVDENGNLEEDLAIDTKNSEHIVSDDRNEDLDFASINSESIDMGTTTHEGENDDSTVADNHSNVVDDYDLGQDISLDESFLEDSDEDIIEDSYDPDDMDDDTFEGQKAEGEDDNLHDISSTSVPADDDNGNLEADLAIDSKNSEHTASDDINNDLGLVPTDGESMDTVDTAHEGENDDSTAADDHSNTEDSDYVVFEDNENLDDDIEDSDIEDNDIEDDVMSEDLDDSIEDDEMREDLDDSIEDDIEDDQEEKKGLFGFIKRQLEKLKNSKIVRKIVIFVTAVAVGLGIYSCSSRNTKEGKMLNSNISDINSNTDNEDAINDSSLIHGNNDLYGNYSYDQLLKVNSNDVQKTPMTNLGSTIQSYNSSFADNYVEEGKDIRAALSFDELVSLQQAYNDYNKDEIKAYFNGAEMNAAKMEQDYKSASLQLMGAHVIETREHPVDMSGLLTSDEAKEFYSKYHEMFLAAKEARGDDKLAKVNAFYKEVKADFPITQEVRTEGIMHADDYDSIESYKLSVTPMIAAAEMMFQNLDVDYTLDNGVIDFLNDIGLCNYAQDKFAKIETITLSNDEDNKNPLYSQYRDSIIGMMKDKGQYVIDDEHRDLSKLDAFQNAVNWHFEDSSEKSGDSSAYITTGTHDETKIWMETDTTYREEEESVETKIPEGEKEKIDQQIKQDNEEEKENAENEAEKTREEMQDEADREADKIEEEVQKDEEDMQEDIDNANDQIDNNNSDDNQTNDVPVNEDDFGDHDVDFDDEHSDSNGNLDDSVENITTDPTGDQTGDELPDPNVTGEKFDEQYNDNNSSNSSADSNSSTNQDTVSEQDTTTSEQEVYAYEEQVKSVSNEELVDAYIENMASGDSYQDENYQYTR